jgi:hypothetical protein
MLLLHGEAILFENLLKMLVVVAIVAVAFYAMWRSGGPGKRN